MTQENQTDLLPALVVALDERLDVVEASPFAAVVTGFHPAELRGRAGAARLFPAAARELLAARLAALQGEEVAGLSSVVECKDGGRRPMAWSARRIPPASDGRRFLLVGQDVTALQDAAERRVRDERIAAMRQLMAGLAHESRNALQRTQVCLEMLSLVVKDRPRAVDLVERFRRAQDDLHRLFEEVQRYATLNPPRLQSCNAGALLQEVWGHLVQAHPGRELQLRVDAESVDLQCRADPALLGQAFRHILDNAVEATSGPVHVSVRWDEVRLDGRPALRATLRDSGPGFAADVRQHLFEPFFTTKPQHPGLGLAVARRNVEAHGGRLAPGAAGPGAELVLTLPREEP
jgi:hypothetical protein